MASSNPKAATAISSGHQWVPPNGRVCCPQPIGESQTGQALVTASPARSTVPSMLPMPLSANATPRTPTAMPAAPRAVEDSWQVTAATPTQTSPTAATEAPASNEPSTGCPLTAIATAITRASTMLAAVATTVAAARPAYRPTTVEASISARPSSSFWRVCRITAKVLINAASTASVRYSRCNR